MFPDCFSDKEQGVRRMDELLTILQSRKSISMPELSKKLHMSEALIYARLERYEQLGYVKRVSEQTGGCSGACGNCKGCGTHRPEFKPSFYWVAGERLK